MRPYLTEKIENEALLLKEIKAKKTIFTAMPPRCTFEISRQCNYVCKKCCYSALSNPPGFHALNMPEWERADIERVADEIFPTMRYTESTLLGEPFLNPNWNWLMGLYRTYGVYYRPTTNGSLITEEKLEQANGVIDWLKCSFDAPSREIYHKLYLRDNFKRVVDNLKMFSRYREKMTPYPWFRVGLVLMNSNMNHLIEYAKFCKNELNVDDIEIMALNFANWEMMDEAYFNRIQYAVNRLTELAYFCIDNKIRLRLPWDMNINGNGPADNSGYERYSDEARGGDIFGGKDCLDDGYVWTNGMRIPSIDADDGTKIATCEYFTRPFLKPPVMMHGTSKLPVEACGSCSTFVFGDLKKEKFRDIWNNKFNQELRTFMYDKPRIPREQWPTPCRKCLCIDAEYNEQNNGKGNMGKRYYTQYAMYGD